MGFAQGVAAGRAIQGQWDAVATPKSNPYAIASTLMRPGPGPRVIKSQAADIALKERALDLEEQKLQMAREAANEARMRQEALDRQAYEDKQRELALKSRAMDQAEEGAIQKRYQSSVDFANKQEAVSAKMGEKQRQDDYALAKQGLAVGNPAPIIEFFDKWGNPDARIENIEFGPDGKDMLVQFSNQEKPAYFKNKDEFFKGLMAFGDPNVEKALLESATKVKSAKAKGKKEGRNPYRVTHNEAAKEYDKQWTEYGELKEGAPPREEWINNYIAKHEAMGGSRVPAKKGPTGPTIKSEVRRKEDGAILRTWTDGTQEVIEPDGTVSHVKSPDGVIYKKPKRGEKGGIGYYEYLKTKKAKSNYKSSKKKRPSNKKQTYKAEYVGRNERTGSEVYKGVIKKKGTEAPAKKPSAAIQKKKAKPATKRGVLVSKQTMPNGDVVRFKIQNGVVIERKVIKKGKKNE